MPTTKLKTIAGDHVVKALTNVLQNNVKDIGLEKAHHFSIMADFVDQKRTELRNTLSRVTPKPKEGEPPISLEASPELKAQFDDLLEKEVDFKPLPHNILNNIPNLSGVDYHALRPLVAEKPDIKAVK